MKAYTVDSESTKIGNPNPASTLHSKRIGGDKDSIQQMANSLPCLCFSLICKIKPKLQKIPQTLIKRICGILFGGDARARTVDLLRVKQAL